MRAAIRTSTALLSGWIAGHLSLLFWVDLPPISVLIAGCVVSAGLFWRICGMLHWYPVRYLCSECAAFIAPAQCSRRQANHGGWHYCRLA